MKCQKKSDDFSSFQMKRLLKRNSLQVLLEEAEKEMGGCTLSLAELETLLKDQGVVVSNESLGNRIASDENTKYLLIKDVKKAMIEAKKQKEQQTLDDIQEIDEDAIQEIEENDIQEIEEDEAKKDTNKENDSEFQKDLQKAIELSTHDIPSTSTESKHKFSFLESFNDADFQSSSEEESYQSKNINHAFSSAKSYMVEYSGLTPNEIEKIMGDNIDASKIKVKTIEPSVNKTFESSTVKAVESSAVDVVVSNVTKQVKMIESSMAKIIEPSTTKIVDSNVAKTVEPIQETSQQTLNDMCDIEVISNASSDSSNDFIEIDENHSQKNVADNSKATGESEDNAIEIVLQPVDVLEDDLFSDIFTHKQENFKAKSPEKLGDIPENKKPDELTQNLLKPTEALKDIVVNDNQNNENDAKSNECDLTKHEWENNQTPLNDGESRRKQTFLTKEQLEEIGQQLNQETTDLISEKISKERMINSLTDQIYLETQELLHLFGLPYIVAPMEAEAQCAFLDIINLTNGTITDDSDIWLFGGKTVYKNFFNQQKYVMEFRTENIQHHFKLTREQMVLLSLLVGSDYTLGLSGIGPVTALEILAAFPSSKNEPEDNNYNKLISGLHEFRKWLISDKSVGSSKTTLKNKLKNVTCNESFPSLQVVKAYLEPSVDTNNEPFSWGKPDIEGLINFAIHKFGWTRTKSENILNPVLKRINDNYKQNTIKNYFQTKYKLDNKNSDLKISKRVKRAIDNIEKGPDDGLKVDKSKTKVRKKHKQKTKDLDDHEKLNISSDEDIDFLIKAKAESKKKLSQIKQNFKNELEKLNITHTQTRIKRVIQEIENNGEKIKKSRTTESLHRKEIIPQKEKDKVSALKSKLKAIEVFRKSKQGPGFVHKKKVLASTPKEDAELSESSSD